jgi:hypothetical protein
MQNARDWMAQEKISASEIANTLGMEPWRIEKALAPDAPEGLLSDSDLLKMQGLFDLHESANDAIRESQRDHSGEAVSEADLEEVRRLPSPQQAAYGGKRYPIEGGH